VTAQLIDAISGGHVWADRYEGSTEDVFGLQDQITSDVVGAIAPSLEMAEIERSRISLTDSPAAYDYYFRGLWQIYRRNRNSINEAEIAFSKAIDLDPNFALAISWLATCCVIRKAQEWMLDKDRETLEGLRLARQSIAIAKDDAVVLAGSGYALAYLGGEFDVGGSLLDRSLALNPNYGRGWSLSGWIQLYVGEPDLAIDRQLKAMRLSPLDPQTHNMITCIATAHFLADRYDESIASAQRALHLEPNWLPARRMLVLANALVGRIDEAQQALRSLLELNPDETSVPFPFKSQQHREKWRTGFWIAGLEK
jgi:tetratricopeptide (TPR) repeat protein